ncbi:FAD-binding domain-containing protein [Tothia fuscella]|uniref:Delta(24)-sterol reductase n=1 Tax=Tothia fuscella TaxID=1048955 RepID=A0A9P4U3S0_9PEZI|nr:FAD-binding domain-containing protein [Tothia fuscella]
MELHNERVFQVEAQVLDFRNRNETFRIYHGSTNSTRRGKWRRDQIVDTSMLNHVLEVDSKRNIVVVEPNVPMDKLVEATLKHGLIPPVVPEFPGITVGGAVVGTAGESSSFRYGFVDSTIEKIEIVLANGVIKDATRTENSDLFFGIASSFGTLGVLTLVELHLIPAKKYVALTYHHTESHAEAVKKILDSVEDPSIDFIDGILYSPTSGVTMTGKLTDDISLGPGVRISRRQDQWFYLRAKAAISKKHETPVTELIPLVDYLFRYDRGGFWTGKYAYNYFFAPFDRFSRWCLDPLMRTRVLYHALHESGLINSYIIQDLALPKEKTERFLQFVDAEFGIYPLWICPLRPDAAGVMNPYYRDGMGVMINVGVWGQGPRRRDEFVRKNRVLEGCVRELGGVKWLYAQTYYTKEEFWDIYDKEAYDDLRGKYGASGLPTVYDKVGSNWEAEEAERKNATLLRRVKRRGKEIRPLRGYYGLAKFALGKDYLLSTKKAA